MADIDIDIDPLEEKLFQTFAYLVGKNTVAWACLEYEIDLLIDAIYIWHNGSKVWEDQPSTAFGRKLKFLNAWAKSQFSPEDISDGDMGTEILRSLSERRNDLIHGRISHMEDGAAVITIIKRKKGLASMAEEKLEFNLLEARADISLKLAEAYKKAREDLEPAGYEYSNSSSDI